MSLLDHKAAVAFATAIPARVAGVRELFAVTPPQRNSGKPHPTVLIAADIADVRMIKVVGSVTGNDIVV